MSESDHNAEYGSVEQWALELLTTTTLEDKLEPPPAPREFEDIPVSRRIDRPGRPFELEVVASTRRSVSKARLRNPSDRARVLHTFLHHELQAAELMCWAILRFSGAPRSFRFGMLAICQDELRHMRMYRDELDRLGHAFGDFPVRNWFWQRVPAARSVAEFVALLGIGLEGANLDHAERFRAWFEEVGDRRAARVQSIVLAEEIPHVAFAIKWFGTEAGEASFDAWRRHLVPPLTPTMLKGRPLNQRARLRAGFTESFLADLERW